MTNSNDKYPLSVIIPVYNGEQYIDRCVESVLSQNIALELILIEIGRAHV